jgi:hypothetical protein
MLRTGTRHSTWGKHQFQISTFCFQISWSPGTLALLRCGMHHEPSSLFLMDVHRRAERASGKHSVKARRWNCHLPHFLRAGCSSSFEYGRGGSWRL